MSNESMAIVEKPINGSNPIVGMYSSLKAESREERLEIFEAVAMSEPLEDHINEKISVENVVIQPVQLVNEVTGEYEDNQRITLITPDKQAFTCTSLGVEIVMKQLFGIVGLPPWEPALDLKPVKMQGNGKYKYTTLILWKETQH